MAIEANIFEKVRETLADALGVDEEEVQEESTLIGDLGPESIDFLDIVFRLEKAFGIKVERGELFPEDILKNEEYVESNRLNANGLAALRERLPFLDLAKFEKNPVVQEFASNMTVADMCRFIQYKLGE